MTQHAKKAAQTRHHASRAKDPVDAIQEASDKALKRADICSGNMGAYAESGSHVYQVLQKMSGEIMESYHLAFTNLAELSRDALDCRTFEDMSQLQHKASKRGLEICFHEAGKLSNLMLNCSSKMLEPITERTATASSEIQKVLAA